MNIYARRAIKMRTTNNAANDMPTIAPIESWPPTAPDAWLELVPILVDVEVGLRKSSDRHRIWIGYATTAVSDIPLLIAHVLVETVFWLNTSSRTTTVRLEVTELSHAQNRLPGVALGQMKSISGVSFTGRNIFSNSRRGTLKVLKELGFYLLVGQQKAMVSPGADLRVVGAGGGGHGRYLLGHTPGEK
jgi:hypothetical protein